LLKDKLISFIIKFAHLDDLNRNFGLNPIDINEHLNIDEEWNETQIISEATNNFQSINQQESLKLLKKASECKLILEFIIKSDINKKTKLLDDLTSELNRMLTNKHFFIYFF